MGLTVTVREIPIEKAISLSVDYGTSDTRVTAYDRRGMVIDTTTRPAAISSPQERWSEVNPATATRYAMDAISELNAGGKYNPDHLIGLSTSDHMHNTIPLMRVDAMTYEPLANGLMWDDHRTEGLYEDIMADHNLRSIMRDASGNLPQMRWMVLKSLHFFLNEKDIYNWTDGMVNLGGYFNYLLTGKLSQQRSNAIGYVGIDGKYSEPIKNALAERYPGFDPKFTGLVDATSRVGLMLDDVADGLRCPRGLDIFAGGGDQEMALIGVGAVKDGVIGHNYGTSGTTLAWNKSNNPDPNGIIHHFDNWFMACCARSGGSLKEYLESQKATDTGLTFDTLVHEASRVPAGAGGLMYFPWSSGTIHPLSCPSAEAAWITPAQLSVTRGLEARAIMEMTAVEMALCGKRMRELGVNINEIRLGGGGARAEGNLIAQLFADTYQAPVTINAVEGLSGLGAGIIPFVGVGAYPDLATACENMISWGGTVTPNKDNAAIYENLGRIYYETLNAKYGVTEASFR